MDKKKQYTVDDLTAIVRRLRQPDGCPWDKVQTHDSIKASMIEESYEAIDALEKNDDKMFANELGDLLLQVVFHAQIADERGAFCMDDVVNEICTKLISRHTHVFGNDAAYDSETALETWEKNKIKEKGLRSVTESMRDVICSLPALTRAAKVQKKAANVGFDWKDISGAMDKLYEEADELRAAIDEKNSAHIEEELGDLLFSAVNVSRFASCDAEETLRHATDKFIDRFSVLEQFAQEQKKNLSKMTIEELESLWNRAKSEKK